MPSSVPAGVYGRRIPVGGLPIPAAVDPSAAFRITMAAIDPSAEPQIDEEHKVPRATLRIIRVPMDLDDEDDEDDEDFDGEDVESIIAKLRAGGVALPEEDEDSEDDSEEEANGGPSDKSKSKKAKEAALKKKIAQELAEDEMEIDAVGKGKAKISAEEDSDEDDLDDEDEEEDEVEEFVLCTLDPERNFQQPLDITVREGEEVYLQVDGTHDVFVTGNYIAFPDDDDEDDEDDEEYDEEYDLSPDEDELDLEDLESEDDELDALENPRVTEVDSEEDAPKLVDSKKNKNKNKRAAEEEASLDDLMSKAATNGEKAAKKVKKNDGQAVAAAAKEPAKKAEKVETPSSDKKKVQFSKNLEMGPTGSPRVDEKKEAAKPAAKGPRNVSGVTVEDKKEGKGKAAKKGDRVEMRYIGKLKNGKVFDSNKKGKPFAFKLGVGQVIKGWDVGVAGMTAGGERRLTIPAAMAYGKKGAPPDIPGNSDLIFDIKCISVN
ncbi:peptidylprolyl isomerase fpr3 [Ascochyta clinopodiicola]|nr:peptidylprolyl isomerase fpr3 [Ascochyta clinopodiicola]